MVTEPVRAGVYPTLGGLFFGCYTAYYVLMVARYFAGWTFQSLGHIVAFFLYLSANDPLQALSLLLLAIFAVSFMLDRRGRAALQLKVLGISFLRKWCAWQNAFLNAQKKAQMLMYHDTSGSDTSSVESQLSSPRAVAAAAREGLTSHRLPATSFKKRTEYTSNRKRTSRKLTFKTLQQQQQQHMSSSPLNVGSDEYHSRNMTWTEWAGYKMRDTILRPLWSIASTSSDSSSDTSSESPPPLSPVKQRSHVSSSLSPSTSTPSSSIVTPQCRHYIHGGISAHPSRRDALENVACAARLQLSSCSLHPSATPYPGHISISKGNNTASQSSSSSSSSTMPTTADDAGQSAVASVGLDGDCPQSIRDIVTDEHLVAFGVLIGEKACTTAARDLNIPPPVESSPSLDAGKKEYCSQSTSSTKGIAEYAAASLLGATDHPEIWTHNRTEDGPDWELIVSHIEEGLHYRAWRLPLRKGLYAYKTSATFLDISPRDLRPFHLDDNARLVWDECALSIDRLYPEFEKENKTKVDDNDDSLPVDACISPATNINITSSSKNTRRLSKHSEWCLHKYVSKFPRPMAARQYVYARRVWHRPSDGGCYAISMACDVPPSSSFSSVSPPRVVDVKDYASGCVIRSVVVDDNNSNSRMGTELLTVYFEDSSVRAGLAKMAVPKALWPYIQKYDTALRQFADTRNASQRSVLASVPIMMRGDGDYNDDDLASVSSDNELDTVYAQLKKKKKRRRRYFGRQQGGRRSSLASAYSIGGGNVNNTRWAKRIAVAAAFKMLHVILMD